MGFVELDGYVNAVVNEQLFITPQKDEDVFDKELESITDIDILVPFEEPAEADKTDPLVYHDPRIKLSAIVKKDKPQYQMNGKPGPDPEENTSNSTGNINGESKDEKNTDGGSNEVIDETKTNGILYPLVRIDQYTLEDENIKSFILDYTGFMPTLELYVNDWNGLIKFSGTPGMNNQITMVIMPSKDGAYKKISLDFSIKTYEKIDDTTLYFFAEYKLLPLRISQTKFLGGPKPEKWFCEPKPCEHHCDKPGELTTWEVLHKIALEVGLGYACTRDLKGIKDHLNRYMASQNYIDYIQEVISYGGLDETQLYDCFISVYNYLTVINLPFVFSSTITYKNLDILATTKVHTTDKNLPEQKFVKVARVLTNFNRIDGPNNLGFTEYEEFSYPNMISDICSEQKMLSFSAAYNSLGKTDLQIKEDSIDGRYVEEYRTQQTDDTYMNMTGRDIKLQEKIRFNYLNKIRSQGIWLTLNDTNFGLERGTLVSVIFYEYDKTQKRKILDGASAAIYDEQQLKNKEKESDPDKFDETEDINKRDVVANEDLGVMNPALSGLYYIDGMEFSFEPEYDDKIVQKLKLIRKDYRNKMNNKHTAPRITDPGPQPPNVPQNSEGVSNNINDITGLIKLKNIQLGY